MSRNLGFIFHDLLILQKNISITKINFLDVPRTSILQRSYYKNISQPERMYISVSKRTFKQQIRLLIIYIKCHSMPQTYFLISYLSHVFQGFSRFFRVQIFKIQAFQGSGFSEYRSRAQVQVLEVVVFKSTDVQAYRCLNKVIHRVHRKWTAASFKRCYGKKQDGFFLKTEKNFLIEVLS